MEMVDTQGCSDGVGCHFFTFPDSSVSFWLIGRSCHSENGFSIILGNFVSCQVIPFAAPPPPRLKVILHTVAHTALRYEAPEHSSIKPRPNALDFSLYIARQMSSIVECCREGVAKRSRLFT